MLRQKEKGENSDEAKRVDAGPCRFDDVEENGIDAKYESRDIASPFVASDIRIVGFTPVPVVEQRFAASAVHWALLMFVSVLQNVPA